MATITASPTPFPHKRFKYAPLFEDRGYCRWRVERNTRQLKTLQIQITTTLSSSYAFTHGEQLQDAPYKELFVDFFREMRGGDYLVRNSSWNLAKALSYEDMARIKEDFHGGGYHDNYTTTSYIPKEAFKKELVWLLNRCGGFNEKFLDVLRTNSKKFVEGLDLKTRDGYFPCLPIFSRAFPRCYETLQSIFTDLLGSEWLQKDICAIQDYTADTTTLDKDTLLTWNMDNFMLWCSAVQGGIVQQERDQQIAKQHQEAWEKDQYGMVVSGALAYATATPIFIVGAVVKMVVSAIARNTDPEGEDFYVQALPTLAAAGVGGLGGLSKELAAALAFDLADLHNRLQRRNQGETLSGKEEAVRNIAMTFVKALLTGSIHGNDEKYLRDILGGLFSEAIHQLPEADDTTPWGRKLLWIALTHPDVQGELINRLLERRAQEQTKPEELTDSQSIDETPEIPEPLDLEEDLDPFVQEGITTGHPPTSIEPQTISLSLSMGVHKASDKEYLVYLDNGQGQHKQIGKFSNQDSAQFFLNKYTGYIARLNEQNREVAQTKTHYHTQGMDPDAIANLPSFDPIYVQISACGSSSNVYQGAHKVLSTGSREAAISKAVKLMDDHVASNAQTIHSFKTEMADQIFKSPSIPHPVKVREVERIISEQHQDTQARVQATQTQNNLDQDLAVAKKKRTTKAKRQRREWRHEKDHATGQAEAYGQRIEDNNFTLQIAEGTTTREEVTQVKQELRETRRTATIAASGLEEKRETFQKTKKDKDHKRVQRATERFNRTMHASTETTNRYYQVQGVDYQVDAPPEVTAPPKATTWGKTQAWVNSNVSGSGEVNVVTVSGPNAPNAPSLVHVKPAPQKTKPTTYTARPQQVHLENSELQAPQSSSSSSYYTYQDTQALERQKMLEANMAFHSAPQPVGRPNPDIDWGRGVARGVQLPPMDMREVRQSGVRSPEQTAPGMKHYPERDRTQSNIPKWLRYFASAGETLDPQERIDRNTQIFVAHTKALSKTFGEIADELRSFGCINAKFDQGKMTLKFDRTVSDRLDQLVSQRLPDMSHVKHFRYVEFTASIANDVMLQAFMMPFFQAQKTRPLLDRALVRPEGFGRQLRAIEAMQRPVYHSGIGSPWSEFVPTQQIHRNGVISERAVAKLTERQITKITPLRLPYLQKGVDYEWFAKHSPRIDALRRIARNDKELHKLVAREFSPQGLNELQIRRTLDYAGFNTYAIPEGLPRNVVVGFADKNGGMIYRLGGSTDKQNLVVRVCPGLAKESLASSVLKGKHLNKELHGTLRQQYPYVVQSRGNLYRTIDGRWVRVDGKKYAKNKAFTHIPLEIYEFKGW